MRRTVVVAPWLMTRERFRIKGERISPIDREGEIDSAAPVGREAAEEKESIEGHFSWRTLGFFADDVGEALLFWSTARCVVAPANHSVPGRTERERDRT